jgi:hypothetical protein
MLICFFFSTYLGDEPLARRLAGQIQRHYPAAVIAALGDGYTPDLAGCLCHGDEVALKRPETIHQYSHQRLAIALQAAPHADLYIQLDPDTYLTRPFRQIPRSEWAGRLCLSDYGPDYRVKHLHGCCWAMRRTLIERLVKENPFKPELYDYPGNVRTDGMAYEDLGFALAVDSVYPNQHWKNWGEVNLGGKLGRFPATHPVKAERIKHQEQRTIKPALRPIK